MKKRCLKQILWILAAGLNMILCAEAADMTERYFAGVEVPDGQVQPAEKSLDGQIRIDVPYMSQEDVLPPGCETMSALMLLAWWEIYPSVEEALSHLYCLSVTTDGRGHMYGPDPCQAFAGDPASPGGYGCYPPVIERMLTELLPDDKKVVNTSGQTLAELEEDYLSKGIPVMIWVTIDMLESYPGSSWSVIDSEGNVTGDIYTWQANEHCVVLVGCDAWNYYLNDPWKSHGTVAWDRELVNIRYEEMGMNSLAVMER